MTIYSQWPTKQSKLCPAYLEKYFNRYDSLMGSSGLPAVCWPLYTLLGNSQGKEITQCTVIFVDFIFSMFVMFYFVSSLGVRNPYIEFNILKMYVLCFNQSKNTIFWLLTSASWLPNNSTSIGQVFSCTTDLPSPTPKTIQSNLGQTMRVSFEAHTLLQSLPSRSSVMRRWLLKLQGFNTVKY